MVIEKVQVIQAETGKSYREVIEAADLPRASYQRWRARIGQDKPLIEPPGPKKQVQLSLPLLMEQVGKMKHRQKRSFGTGRLYQAHRQEISRRRLQKLVKQERSRIKAEHRRSLRKITWHVPGLVWAIDGVEHGGSDVMHVQDLASHYKIEPTALTPPTGQAVAGHLEQLIEAYGPPLILKRDHGSNLQDQAVEALLEKYLIIPLDSPCRYPKYNGAMEHAQGELQGTHRIGPPLDPELLKCLALTAHTLNHRRRPSLNGQSPCTVFACRIEAMKPYTRQKRKEVIDWIKHEALAILHSGGSFHARAEEKAWRRAVESWLHREGHITVKVEGKVLPYFQPNLVSRSGR